VAEDINYKPRSSSCSQGSLQKTTLERQLFRKLPCRKQPVCQDVISLLRDLQTAEVANYPKYLPLLVNKLYSKHAITASLG